MQFRPCHEVARLMRPHARRARRRATARRVQVVDGRVLQKGRHPLALVVHLQRRGGASESRAAA
eukprot:2340859-Prymnesium_polylepis.1